MCKIERTLKGSQKTTAIVLAGGMGTRMGGYSKSHLPIGGITLIEHIINQLESRFQTIIIGANSNQDFGFLKNAIVVRDVQPEKGPLMGLFSCLSASQSEVSFVTTCDNPEPNLELALEMIKVLGKKDAVVPKSPVGKLDPLFAVYRKSVAENAKHLLDQGIGKVMKLLDFIDVRYFDTYEENKIKNINSPKDFEEFLKKRQVILQFKKNS